MRSLPMRQYENRGGGFEAALKPMPSGIEAGLGAGQKDCTKAELIAKSEYEVARSDLASCRGGPGPGRSRVEQAKAQRIRQNAMSRRRAPTLTRVLMFAEDYLCRALRRESSQICRFERAKTVVIGIQNSPGSTLMTFADMSVITAEVKVDETDIVNVKLGQPAEVTIDAIPKKIFHGA